MEEITHKQCSKCQEVREVSEFYRANKGTSLFPECKPCSRERARNWNRERRAADPTYAKARTLWYYYRLTPERYAEIFTSQGEKCGACGAGEPGGRGFWHVDHDHACCPGNRSCGKCVRGVLCSGCNSGLGMFNDDPDRLLAAAAYLLSRVNVLTEF